MTDTLYTLLNEAPILLTTIRLPSLHSSGQPIASSQTIYIPLNSSQELLQYQHPADPCTRHTHKKHIHLHENPLLHQNQTPTTPKTHLCTCSTNSPQNLSRGRSHRQHRVLRHRSLKTKRKRTSDRSCGTRRAKEKKLLKVTSIREKADFTTTQADITAGGVWSVVEKKKVVVGELPTCFSKMFMHATGE